MEKETAQTLSLESVDPIPAWLKFKVTASFSYSKIRTYESLKACLSSSLMHVIDMFEGKSRFPKTTYVAKWLVYT